MAVTTGYGAAPTYVKIASQTLNGTSASITFSNIPQGYTDLVIVGTNLLSNRGSSQDLITITFNGDTGANYSATQIDGTTGGATSTRWTALSAAILGFMTDNNATANASLYPSNILVNIQGYSNTSFYKTFLTRYNMVPSTASYSRVGAHAALWRSTAPITSLTFSTYYASYLAGSTFTLYGIKAAFVPKATGGDIIVNDGTYWYHAFKTTGAFVPSQALTVASLVVGGGGGGGTTNSSYFAGGGGGAGGYVYTASSSLTGGSTYPITIGSGGVGLSVNSPEFGTKSTFNSINGYGGGRGYPGQNSVPNDNLMGSGGGASASQTASSTYLASGQGYKGGDSSGQAGGGGGGAGAAGGTGGAFQGGNGGAGLNTWASWAYATGTGSSGYYCGGGGGGNSPYYGTPTTNPTTGGAGGGGNGATSGSIANGVPGASGTGSGGGGGSALNTLSGYSFGGNGGSGLVIVRYAI